MLVTKSPGGTQYWWLHGGAAVSIGSHLEHSRDFCKCVAAADARKSSCVYGGILHFLRSVLNDIFRKGRRERTCTTSHEGTACAAFCIYVQHLCRWIYQLLSAAIWNWKQFTHDRNLFWDEESEQSLQAKSRGSSMPLILTYMDTLLGLQPVAHTGWAQLCSPPLLLPSVHWMLISFVILPKQNLEGFWNTLGTNLKVCSLEESLQKQTNEQTRTRNTQNLSLENVLRKTETHRTKCITRLFLHMHLPCCCFSIVADLVWNSNQASPDSVLCSSVLLGVKPQAQPPSLFHVFFSLNTNQGAAESFRHYSTEKIFSSSFLVSSSWLRFFLLAVFAWK